MVNDPELANRLHINTILVMLPYDMDKVEKLPSVQFKLDKEHGIYSFLDTHGKRQHYKLIADSDDRQPASEHSKSHDAAAFLKVDAQGSAIADAKGKPQVTVTFPGLNNPLADFESAAMDKMQTTSYQESFFSDFTETHLKPALAKLQVAPRDVEVVAHSMGNKHAYEYVSRFGSACAMSIDRWDEKDALIGAAIRHAVQQHSGKHVSTEAFNAQVSFEVRRLSQAVMEVNAQDSQESSAAHNFTAIGAKHRAGTYIDKTSGMMVETAGQANIRGLQALATGATSLMDKMHGRNGSEKAETFFLQEMENHLRADGGLSAKDKAALSQVQESLKQSGLQVDTMTQAYAKYMAPQPGTDKGPSIKR